MEVIIKSINLTENSKIIKSINWEYNTISGCLELQEPDMDNFILFENITKDVLKEWLINLIDFSRYDILENIQEFDKIINLEI